MEDIKTIIKEYSEEIKKHNEGLKEDIKRYVGVLHEDFGHKNQLLAEAISGVQSRLDTHAEAVAAVKEDTEIIKLDLGFVKNTLQKKVDIEQFMVLERRVANLESRIRA